MILHLFPRLCTCFCAYLQEWKNSGRDRKKDHSHSVSLPPEKIQNVLVRIKFYENRCAMHVLFKQESMQNCTATEAEETSYQKLFSNLFLFKKQVGSSYIQCYPIFKVACNFRIASP